MSRTLASVSQTDADDAALAALGIQPTLSRKIHLSGTWAASFSVISILSGCMTLFGFGLAAGGPAEMMWGWITVSIMTLLLAAALAEVTSRYPTSGGLYYMAAQLGGRGWAWVTGWLNALGLIGGIAGIDYGAAQFVGALLALKTGYVATPGHTMIVFAVILLLHAVLNLGPITVVDRVNRLSMWWHLGGVLLIVAVLIVAPDQHPSATWVFSHWHNGTSIHSGAYVTGIGLLLAGYTYCGWDISPHLAEETLDPQRAAPRGMVRAVWVSAVAGTVLLFGLCYGIQDYGRVVNSPTGVPPAQIFLDAVGTNGAACLLLVVIMAQLFCGHAETAAASRMLFAFSRDGALPYSGHLRRVNASRTPTRAVWAAVAMAFLLALPALWSLTAYNAVVAINVVGIVPSYAIPVLLRLRRGRRFEPGPWHLGRWSTVVGTLAVLWVGVITVLFLLPQAWPVSATNFNYAGVALLVAGVVMAVRWIGWSSRFSVPSGSDTPVMRAAAEEVV